MNSEVLKRTAQSLFLDCTTTEEKIDAVVSRFSEYEYNENTTVPNGKHPIEWFVSGNQSGHCEFFASATVALLREAEVPCRYVTGFVVTEQNLYGEYWVARNQDAHAWAEAWVDGKGWVVVEATPAAGQPQQRATSTFTQLREYLSSALQSFRYELAIGGISWLAGWLFSWFANPIFLTMILLTAIWLWIRRKRRTKEEKKPRVQPDPKVVSLNKLLEQMDKRLAAVNLHRDPNETLHQFAARIQASAEARDQTNQPQLAQSEKWSAWYREYARVRYDVNSTTNEISLP